LIAIMVAFMGRCLLAWSEYASYHSH